MLLAATAGCGNKDGGDAAASPAADSSTPAAAASAAGTSFGPPTPPDDAAPAPAAATATMPTTTTIEGKTVTLKTMPDGIRYYDMKVGTGATAKPGQTASMQYTGTLLDGTKFDSSYDRNAPFDFTIGAGSVIKGWDEGVPSMKVGGKRRLIIPSELAYGASPPSPAIPPNSILVFDVELVAVK